jgi:hypothetical protein
VAFAGFLGASGHFLKSDIARNGRATTAHPAASSTLL